MAGPTWPHDHNEIIWFGDSPRFRVFERDRARDEKHVWVTLDTERDAWRVARRLTDLYAETGRTFWIDRVNVAGSAIVTQNEVHGEGCACSSCTWLHQKYD